MSSAIEDRLTAALEARAELVTAEDLRPLEVPDRARSLRPGVAIALAAAAAAIVVAAPFVIGRINDGDASPTTNGQGTTGPQPTTPTVTQTSDAGQSDFVVADRQHADVDGDGQPDDVRMLLDSKPDGLAVGLVDVTLATGATGSAPVPLGYPPHLLPAFDISGDGHEQVLLSFTAGGDEAQLLVYTWFSDSLVQAREDGHTPLALGLDGEGKYADYYRQDGLLYSWLRGDPVDPGGWPMFTVRQWSWSVEGDKLIAAPAGTACVDATAQRPPSPCK
jgi:hypothetical protein